MPDIPGGNPPTFQVIKLEDAAQLREKRNGRPKKLKMPPLPQALLDAMTPLEQEHFLYFLDAMHQEHPDLTNADEIALTRAAVEYINCMRVEVKQLASGEVISMARQHPGVQLRAWMDTLSVTRKQRKPTEKSEMGEWRDALTSLSKGS